MPVKTPVPAANPANAGYSGTPLAKKLGLVAGCRVLAFAAPPELTHWLQPLPERVQFVSRANATTDIALVFATRRDDLRTQLTRLRASLRADAAVWACWPKQAGKVETDISENGVRDEALPLGFVDVKVCAVSAVWSGLKLVVRKELR